jgi:uncharacterized membrane protein YdcZ (DUF606 family)
MVLGQKIVSVTYDIFRGVHATQPALTIFKMFVFI